MSQDFQVSKNEDGQRLDRFLRQKFAHLPLSMIYKFLRTKKIKVNSKPAKRDYLLQKGDVLRIFFNPMPPENIVPKTEPDWSRLKNSPFYKKNFHILFEDEWLLVLNKPANLAVHPGSGVKFAQNLIDLATAYILTQNPKAPAPRLAHRLDKNTSGIVILAKNGGTLRNLQIQEKHYQALVKGHLAAKKGTIRDKILRNERGVQVSQKREAKEAITHYQVVQEFSDSSLLNIKIDTGRTHQIRVHFAHLKHPLAGDEQHGDFAWNKILKQEYGLKRHFLHACQVVFMHPETNQEIKIIAPLTSDLQVLLNRLSFLAK